MRICPYKYLYEGAEAKRRLYSVAKRTIKIESIYQDALKAQMRLYGKKDYLDLYIGAIYHIAYTDERKCVYEGTISMDQFLQAMKYLCKSLAMHQKKEHKQ